MTNMLRSKTGPTNLSDAATVLINHAPMIQTRLDNVIKALTKGGVLFNFFKGDVGKDLLNNIKNSKDSKKAYKAPKQAKNELSPHYKIVKDVISTVDYAVSWSIETKIVVNAIIRKSTDLDIRYNYIPVIQVSELFVNFAKISLFFHLNTTCKNIVDIIPSFKELAEVPLATSYDKIRDFVNAAAKNPFKFIRKQVKSIGIRMAALCTQISPFLLQVFEYWPVIDWGKLSPFEKTDEKQETTLPPTLNLVLRNLTLFRDTTTFFLIIFPEYPIEVVHFSTLLKSVLSEVSSISLTPFIRLPIEKLLSVFIKVTKKNELMPLFETVAYERELKNEVSHKQRLIHTYNILRDVNDIVSFNADYLPRLMNEIIPLAALGEYEVSAALISGLVLPEVSKMVDVLVDLALLFNENEDLIKRFFLYNLTTLDETILRNMLKLISQLTDSWQVKMANHFREISDALHMIDIEEFDAGSRYDLTPFITTACRLFYLFNQISAENQAAFLHPIFEHLIVVITHAEIVQSPSNFFNKICPIYKLWRFTKEIKKYMEELPGGIQTNSGFIPLFQFFNNDKKQLINNTIALTDSINTISDIRDIVWKSIQEEITGYMQPHSLLLRIGNQSNLLDIFDPTPLMIDNEHFSITTINGLVNFQDSFMQIGHFISRIPMELNIYGTKVEFLHYIAEGITGELTTLMFGKNMPTAPWLNSAFTAAPELIWPLFMQMRSSFPFMLTNAKSINSTYNGQESYLEQISIIRQSTDIHANDSGKKLIRKFEDKITDFIYNKSSLFIFDNYGERFEPSTEKLGSEFSTLLSYEGFYAVIMNLGPQAGFCLNKIIVSFIAKTMIKIFKIHFTLLASIGDWWIKFRKKDNSWIQDAVKAPEIKEASKEMVKLGTALQLRAFLRKAINNVISISAPGLLDLIIKSLIRDKSDQISEKQDFLAEMVSGLPTFHFIIIAIEKEGLLKTSDCQQFYFFLAILLLNPDWNDAKFINQLEGFTHNLHLIPSALDAFLSTNRCFVNAHDTKKVEDGLAAYFDTLSTVIQYKRNAPNTEKLLGDSLVILADIYPKYISKLQYGTVAQSFPINVVFDAYQKFETNSPIDEARKQKKANKKK